MELQKMSIKRMHDDVNRKFAEATALRPRLQSFSETGGQISPDETRQFIERLGRLIELENVRKGCNKKTEDMLNEPHTAYMQKDRMDENLRKISRILHLRMTAKV
jgi:hypothetical protein